MLIIIIKFYLDIMKDIEMYHLMNYHYDEKSIFLNIGSSEGSRDGLLDGF